MLSSVYKQTPKEAVTPKKSPRSAPALPCLVGSAAPESHGLLALQRQIGNRAMAGLLKAGPIQAFMTVGAPDDKYEREADRIASQIMTEPDNGHFRTRADESGPLGGPIPGRQPAQRSPRVPARVSALGADARKSSADHRIGHTVASAEFIRRMASARTGSMALPRTERDFFESRLGAPLSGVRLHDNPQAHRLCRELGARAFTRGQDIFFGAGQMRGEGALDRRLMGHELAHVLQQKNRGSGSEGSASAQSHLQRAIVGSSFDPIHEPLIEAYRAAMGFPFGGVDPFTGQQIGPSDAEIKYSGILSQWLRQMRDDELQARIQSVRGRIRAAPASSAERTALETALNMLESEAQRRPAIVTRGTVSHTGAVGSGATRGTVEVRTGEEVQVGGVNVGNVLTISYAGANAANARWLQFVWFEMTVTTPSAVGRLSGSIPTTSGTKPFTTDPAAPDWSIDSDTEIPFYIYGGGLGIRDANTQAMFDRPGGASVGPLFQAVLSSVADATSATFTAHFSTFLVINDTVVYNVPWTAATTATVTGATATIASVVYGVGAAGAATSLPANLRTILHRDYPSYRQIR